MERASLNPGQTSGLSYQELMCAARELWAQTHRDGLIRCFAELLHSHFQIQAFTCLSLHFRGGRLTFQKLAQIMANLEPLQSLNSQTLQAWQTNFSLWMQDDEAGEWADSYESLVCEGVKVFWLLLGNPRQEGLVCLWDGGQIEPRREALDFIARLLKRESSWYLRLDNTQALLYRDELTGLFNYRYLDIALDSELRRASRYQNHFSLLFVDLDDFKQVNDHFGHLAGSAILKQVGRVLQEELREVDTIIRYGGDEYVIILLGAATKAGVLVADRIRKRIALTPFKTEGLPISITCSIGVACYPEHGNDKESLLKIADETMYQSKRKGKNQVMIIGQGDAPQEASLFASQAT